MGSKWKRGNKKIPKTKIIDGKRWTLEYASSAYSYVKRQAELARKVGRRNVRVVTLPSGYTSRYAVYSRKR